MLIGASTAPTTAPTIDPAVAYRQGVSLIQDGKPADAQKLLLQADRASSHSAKIATTQHADIVYAFALCAMQQENWPAAHQSFERLQLTRGKDRELILNNSKVDLAIKNRNVNAVKSLDTYLSSCDKPDEVAINLFGGAIDQALQSPINKSAVGAAPEHFIKFNEQLEKTKPGMHHWGQQWITKQQFKSINNRKKDAQKTVDNAQDDLNLSQKRLNQAQGRYDDELQRNAGPQRNVNKNGYSDARTVDPNVTLSRTNSHTTEVQNAQADVQRAKDKLNEAQLHFPRPTWTVSLKPILPEDWTAPEITTAVATPQTPTVMTFEDLLQKMAADCGPAAGAPWTQLNVDLAQNWPKTNAVGKPLTISATYVAGSVRPDGTIAITCTINGFTKGGLTVDSAKVIAQLDAGEAPKVAKLVAGQSINASGTIQGLRLASLKSDPANVRVEVQLANAVLQP